MESTMITDARTPFVEGPTDRDEGAGGLGSATTGTRFDKDCA